MCKQITNWLVLSLVILFACGMQAYSQEEVERAKAPFRPSEPPRLYVAPTADIIPSLDLSISVSGAFGAKGTGFQGVTAFGLADIAQIEAYAISVVSGFDDGSLGNVYAPGFKMLLLREGRWSYSWLNSPGVAWALRSSVWQKDMENRITYEKKAADLYFVVTERLGPLSLHAGLDIFDARMTSSVMEEQGRDEVKKNFLGPFAGVDMWVTERGKAMAEFGWTTNFKYAEDGIQKEEDIESIWMAILGVRFFPMNYLAVDVGVRYQENYEGVSDANIEIKLDLSIPTHVIYEHARGKR